MDLASEGQHAEPRQMAQTCNRLPQERVVKVAVVVAGSAGTVNTAARGQLGALREAVVGTTAVTASEVTVE